MVSGADTSRRNGGRPDPSPTSEWNTDDTRPRKFYRTTAAGRTVRTALADEWRALDRSLTDSIDHPRRRP